MNIQIKENYLLSKEDILGDINRLGLWPFAQEVDGNMNEEPHWHDHDNHIYVLSGLIEVVDGTGATTEVSSGGYVYVPKKTIHAMNIVKKCLMIVGTTKPINFMESINLCPDLLSGEIA